VDANTLLNQLVGSGAVPQSSFGPESRYFGVALASWTDSRGDQVRYVRRRFIPPASSFALLNRYRVVQGDRVDVLGARLLGDPLAYWRLCDANEALDPDDVTAVPGAFIRVTLPPGVPGAS